MEISIQVLLKLLPFEPATVMLGTVLPLQAE
jgi:hypothetical protein